MDYLILIGCLLAGYLIGSISFSRIVTRIWSGKDVAEFEVPVAGEEETYKVVSIGANSVSSVLGAKAGMVVSSLDILKVFLPTFAAGLLFPDSPMYAALTAIGGMLGHIWPIYYKFHGGAGYSAIMGGLLALDPLAVLVLPLAGTFLGVVVFRNFVIATISWLWLLIPWMWFRKAGEPAYIIYAVAMNIFFVLAMIPEIRKGLEYKKQGKLEAYGLGYLSSNPMGRGLLKMAEKMGFGLKLGKDQ